MSHPRSALSKELLAPLRLSIIAALSGVEEAEFALIRGEIQTTDAELSRQLTRLADAGFLTITKKPSGRYTKTWLCLTDEGRNTLRQHIAALQAITNTAIVST